MDNKFLQSLIKIDLLFSKAIYVHIARKKHMVLTEYRITDGSPLMIKCGDSRKNADTKKDFSCPIPSLISILNKESPAINQLKKAIYFTNNNGSLTNPTIDNKLYWAN